MNQDNFPRYFNEVLWSDVNPYELVRKVSDKTVEVRPLKTTRHPDWKPDVKVGGFAGHTVNQHEQKWIYESNPNAPTIRLRKAKKQTNAPTKWVHKGRTFYQSSEPEKFYDYNF